MFLTLGKFNTYKIIAKAAWSPLPFTQLFVTVTSYNYKTFIKNQEINLDTWVLTKVQALFKYYHLKKNTAIFLFQSNPGFLCWIHAYVVSSNVGQSSVFSCVYDLDMFEEYWFFVESPSTWVCLMFSHDWLQARINEKTITEVMCPFQYLVSGATWINAGNGNLNHLAMDITAKTFHLELLLSCDY